MKVLFFGATAAITGKREIDIEVVESSISGEVFAQVLSEFPGLASHRLLFSVNQQYSDGDEIVRDGDELAVFTAVSGG